MMGARELLFTSKAIQPYSLRELTRKYATNSYREARARFLLSDYHRKTGGRFGLLGAALGPGVRQNDGSYLQKTQLGVLTLGDDVAEAVKSQVKILGEVSLAAVRCFGTEDPGGTDELYVVVSVVSINPAAAGSDKLAFTIRTEITDTKAGDVRFQSRTLGEASAFPGSGLRIHIAIFDHEHGDADELRDKIQAALDDAAKKGSAALAGGVAAGAADTGSFAGAAGDIIDFEVGGIKPFKLLTLGLASALTEALKDDLVDEHEFVIPAEQLAAWAEGADGGRFPKYESSLRTSADLPAEIRFNWSPKPEQEHLFSGGSGSYKVYLHIKPVITTRPGPAPLIP